MVAEPVPPATPANVESAESLVSVSPSPLGRYLLAGLVGVAVGVAIGWLIAGALEPRAGHYPAEPPHARPDDVPDENPNVPYENPNVPYEGEKTVERQDPEPTSDTYLDSEPVE